MSMFPGGDILSQGVGGTRPRAVFWLLTYVSYMVTPSLAVTACCQGGLFMGCCTLWFLKVASYAQLAADALEQSHSGPADAEVAL